MSDPAIPKGRLIRDVVGPSKQKHRTAVKSTGDANGADMHTTGLELASTSSPRTILNPTTILNPNDVPLACHGLIPVLQRLVDAKNSHQELQLGHEIRTSSRYRELINCTTTTLLNDLGQNHESPHTILPWLRDCNRLMTLSNLSEHTERCHLLLAPREVRDLIWGYVLGKDRQFRQPSYCTLQTESDSDESKQDGVMLPNHCDASRTLKWNAFFGWRMPYRPNLGVLSVSKQVSEETMQVLYRYNTFNLPCTCQLIRLLLRPDVRQSLRSVRFGLAGSQRVEAIQLLWQCPNLKELEITISAASRYLLSSEEKFNQLCGLSNPHFQRKPQLFAILGVKELRGIGFKKKLDLEVSILPFEKTKAKTMTDENAKDLGRYMDANPDNNSAIELWEGSKFKEKKEGGDEDQ